jgi:Na+/proline symporter
MQVWVLVCSSLFLVALTAVGVWHTRRIKTGEDFALAGRRLPTPVVFGTLVATWIGTGSLFGNAEFTYEHGWIALVLPLAGAAGILCLAPLAARVRDIPADSVPQILGIRFGRAAQLVGAIALIGAYLIIVSYQFRAGAGILRYVMPQSGEWMRSVAGAIVPALGDSPIAFWNQVPGVIGFAVFVILYTMLAGMVSVAWTDLINGVLMAVGILLALGMLVARFLAADPAVLAAAPGPALPAPPIPPVGWVGLLLPTFLLVLGDANLYQRFMSARSPRAAHRAAVWMFFGVLVMEWAIIGIASFGRLLLPFEPEVHGHTVIAVAFTLLPGWLGVILIMSGVAVIVTTADSYLLGSATSVAADLTGKLTTARRQRLIVLGLGLAAIALAFTSDRFFKVALYAYTLYGATLTPAVVCALVWPRIPAHAIVGGMIAGLGTALSWKALELTAGLPDAAAAIEPVLPALGMNLLVLAVLSRWGGRPGPSGKVRAYGHDAQGYDGSGSA